MRFFHFVILAFISTAATQVTLDLTLRPSTCPNLCLTVATDPPFTGVPVRLAACTCGVQQLWGVNPNTPPIPTVEDPSFCLTANFGSGTLQASPCDGSTGQGFRFNTNTSQILLPIADGLPSLCVTVGSQLEICNPNDPNQIWNTTGSGPEC